MDHSVQNLEDDSRQTSLSHPKYLHNPRPNFLFSLPSIHVSEDLVVPINLANYYPSSIQIACLSIPPLQTNSPLETVDIASKYASSHTTSSTHSLPTVYGDATPASKTATAVIDNGQALRSRPLLHVLTCSHRTPSLASSPPSPPSPSSSSPPRSTVRGTCLSPHFSTANRALATTPRARISSS
jgi:hypothetical protein